MRRGRAAAAGSRRQTGSHGPLLARVRTRAKSAEAMTLVDVHDLVKHYAGERSWFGLGRPQAPVRAVDGVSFTIAAGRTLGLVGESGSGKTTLGRTMLRLQEPTSGTVLFDDNDVFALDAARLRGLRRRMQIVFQDPYGSLNPRMTVEDTLREPLEIHGLKGAVAALRHIADDVAVMYLGKIVERAPAAEIYTQPRHPYTRALLSAVPEPTPHATKQRILLPGDIPSPAHPPSGCPFHPRCPHPRKNERRRTEPPPLRTITPGHDAACHYAEEPM